MASRNFSKGRLAVLATTGVLALGGFSLVKDYQEERKDTNDYNKLAKKIESIDFSADEAVSDTLERELGITISDECSEFLDDQDAIKRVLEISNSPRPDYVELATLSSTLTNNTFNLIVQRTYEENKKLDGKFLSLSKDGYLYTSDKKFVLDNDSLGQVVTDVLKVTSGGTVSISDQKKQQENIDNCTNLVYDMLKLCATDIEFENNFIAKDKVSMKVKK